MKARSAVIPIAAASALTFGALPASAAPPEPLGLPQTVPGALINCPFDVQVTVVGEPQSQKFTMGPRGTKMIFGGTRIIYTNLSNGNTLRVTGAGNFKTGTEQPDGTTPASVSGSFFVSNTGDIPGLAPGIYDFIGRVTFRFTSNGDIVQPAQNGRAIDVCAALA